MDRYSSLIAYHNWANRNTFDQVKSLSTSEFEQHLGGSFPSLKLTITHLLISDWMWLNRWQGNSKVTIPADWDTSTVGSIEAIWQPIQEKIEHYFQADLTARLEETVTFRAVSTGDTYTVPLWQTINHVANHGTYHRGQITNMVRMLGYQPVKTDLFIFYNEENKRE